MTEHVTCPGCQQSLPHDVIHFNPHKKCTGGLRKTCRTCINARNRAWIAKATEVQKERRRAYQAAYKLANRGKYNAYNKNSPSKRARSLRSSCKRRARAAGLPFDTDYMGVPNINLWLRKVEYCECCDARLVKGTKHFSERSFSIDKVVPSQGYVPGNVAILCWRCNSLKNNGTAFELRRLADWIDGKTNEVSAHFKARGREIGNEIAGRR